MPETRVERTIAAPPEQVFELISSPEKFKAAIPHIQNIEYLSDSREGVGTRFRETRLMGKREASTVLEITECVAPSRVRLVSDAGGTIWDSVFTVEPSEGGSRLTLVMESRPYRLWAKLMNKMIGGMLEKALAADMDAVKAHLEGASPN